MVDQVQRLGHDQLDASAALYVDVFNGEPWNDRWSVSTARQRLHQMFTTPEFIGLGLWEKEDLVGICLGHVEQYFQRRHYMLQEMCVRMELQRTGRESRLLGALVQALRPLDVEQIYLNTMRDGPAARFYANHDFQPAALSEMMVRRFD